MSLDDLMLKMKARGNWGHGGRPGKRGGSTSKNKIEVSPGKFAKAPSSESPKKSKQPKGKVSLIEKGEDYQTVKVGDTEIGHLRQFQALGGKMRWSLWLNEEFDTKGGPPAQYDSPQEAVSKLSKRYDK